MKIIDLLNKIANGEKIPKKIEYDNVIWNYDEISRDYILIDKSGEEALICEELNLMFALNDEVEIIEEDKKIEKIELTNGGLTLHKKIDDIDEDIPTNSIERTLVYKINEIIDYLDKENKND